MSTVHELVQRFGSRWSETEVEAAVWKLVGDAAASGRLLVDLTEVELARGTPLALLEPGSPPILPDPLPSSLEEVAFDSPSPESSSEGDLALDPRVGIPGPTFDASVLATTEEQILFNRNLAAVTAVLAGMGVGKVAHAYDMGRSTLSRLVRRTKELGQIACVPHGTYHRERALHPELQQLIRKLYTQPIRPSVMAVYQDVQLKQLALELSEREHQQIASPTYKQVWKFLKAIAHETPVKEARSGLKHFPHERMSPKSFVLSIASPALVCQVDEHTMDLLVVAPDGTVITSRVHGAVLICVKTAAILGAVLSLDSLKEEDYMRLVKMSLEPKDRITALYECHHRWPCSGKPAVIFHDRGKIFTGVSGPGRYWLTAWVSRQSKRRHMPHQRKGRWKLSLPGSRASLPIVSLEPRKPTQQIAEPMIAKQRRKKRELRSMSSKSCLSSRLLMPICKNGITCDVAVGSHYGKTLCKKKAYRATLAHPMI